MKNLKKHSVVFKKLDKFWHGAVFSSMCFFILLATLRCSDDWYIGEAKRDISRQMFEIDSIMKTIQMQIDSTSIDFEKFYIDAQRINNGH